MKLVTKWFGVFLVEDNKIVKYELFPKNSDEIAERLKKINNGKILDEEKKLAEDLKVEKSSESEIPRSFITQSDTTCKFLCDKKVEADIDYTDYGFTPDLLHDATIKLGKMLAGKTSEERHVIQAVNAIDELNNVINIMTERFMEWYLYHFPEEKKEKDFMKIIVKYGSGGTRKLFQRNQRKVFECRESYTFPTKTNPETEQLEDVASSILALQKTKKRLEKYIEKSMKKIAPNLSSFAGPMISAKLISLAGSLGRLSIMPSSTIQLLGAEKALFRHLKGGGKSPKHGILLQHPIVHQADYKQRGRIARIFANNIAIAVKADCYSKRFIADELGKRFKKQIN